MKSKKKKLLIDIKQVKPVPYELVAIKAKKRAFRAYVLLDLSTKENLYVTCDVDSMEICEKFKDDQFDFWMPWRDWISSV